MFVAIDDNNKLISIDEYFIKGKINGFYSPVFCPFCNKKLLVKSINSQEKTHFSHKSHQSCSFKSYAEFFKSEGKPKTNEDILKLKKEIILSSFTIFLKLKQEYIGNLESKLFLNTLKKVSNHKILSLRNIKCEHIPYIWLNELGKFENKIFLYTNSSKIDFDKQKYNTPKLWNTREKKDIIITVIENKDKSLSRYVTQIDLNFSNYWTSFDLDFLSEISSEIFDIFSISNDKDKLILNEILSKKE